MEPHETQRAESSKESEKAGESSRETETATETERKRKRKRKRARYCHALVSSILRGRPHEHGGRTETTFSECSALSTEEAASSEKKSAHLMDSSTKRYTGFRPDSRTRSRQSSRCFVACPGYFRARSDGGGRFCQRFLQPCKTDSICTALAFAPSAKSRTADF